MVRAWPKYLVAVLALLMLVLQCAGTAAAEVYGFGGQDPYSSAQELAIRLRTFGHLAAGFVGVAAVAVLIIAAYMFITSGGSEERLTKAKKAMLFATVGIGIALMAEVIVGFVVKTLVPGESVPPSYPRGMPQDYGELPGTWLDAVQNEMTNILGSTFGKIVAIPIQLLAYLLFTLVGAKYPHVLIYNLEGIGKEGLTEKLYHAGPFSDAEWQLIGEWYTVFSGLVGAFIVLAVVVNAYRLLVNFRDNPGEYAEAKMGILHCLAALFMVMCAPLVFKVLGDVNNGIVSLLYWLVTSVPAVGSVPDLIDPRTFFEWTPTLVENPIGYAVVLLAAAGLTLAINVIYIVRHFVLLVFLVMTPVFAAMYALSRSRKVFGLWAGEIVSNLFMQSIHAFVWTLFIVFQKFWASI
ncbi:pilin [Moorellaceae bacterium AZ2]